jgi:uncharacterized membrane protein YcaP (DUF421 family)
MESWWKTNWAGIFIPQMPLPEIIVRSALIYVALCFLIRVIPKRTAGKVSISDMLFVVLIAGVAVDGISKNAESLPDFFLILLAVFFWNFLLDWLAYRNAWFRRLVQEPPTCLIRDGKLIRKNLRLEMMSEEELNTQLRIQGIDDLSLIHAAYLEADGGISVVKNDAKSPHPSSTTKPTEVNDASSKPQ